MINSSHVIKHKLTQKELTICIENAKHILANIVDRHDLHERDDLERFNNILMGEVAEMMVLKWLHSNNKYAISTVDKTSTTPDIGHDIQLRTTSGKYVNCSIKSSLSALKDLDYIVDNFKLATKKSELRDANIQVYFWLDINPKDKATPRTTVMSLKNAAIIGWFHEKDLTEFESYATEKRESPSQPLKNARPMASLLQFIS